MTCLHSAVPPILSKNVEFHSSHQETEKPGIGGARRVRWPQGPCQGRLLAQNLVDAERGERIQAFYRWAKKHQYKKTFAGRAAMAKKIRSAVH